MAELSSLDAVTEAVESGAGLPEVVRAAARALDASLAVTDAQGGTLAVAARSPAEERSLLAGGDGVSSIPLRVADAVVGSLHVRARTEPSVSMRRLLVTMIASEVERVRAPGRASENAAADFLRAILARELSNSEELLARGRELSLELQDGASMIVARAHPQAPTEDGWRSRVRAVAERGARAVASRSIAALTEREGGAPRPAGGNPAGATSAGRGRTPGPEGWVGVGGGAAGAEVLLLVPGGEEAMAARAADSVLRELQAGLPGCTFAVGRSRIAEDPSELPRAASEALLAANVAEGGGTAAGGGGGSDPAGPALAFEQTGAYRLLLSTMSDNPRELQRFYAETVEPLVAYDEQYETELVRTLETFLDADGNVAGTAQRLFTHRHTIYYRLERVRELSGLDVGSSDGREKLSLGLKAMRVLGIAHTGGPASEAGAGGGRVPRGSRRS
ncbi:MAG TPA: helix-turn-helix domain-containing protein [Solirubrobacteraceae bacterium]|nr:helix-turn-helix domain-containing protein [Solirubrobacteraceae bacterium]